MSGPGSGEILSACERIYHLLLYLYPEAHRREYGLLMAQAFRDLCRERHRQAGILGLAKLWMHTLPDVATTAVAEHWEALRKEGLPGMQRRSFAPLPWAQVALAVSPGLFAVGVHSGLFKWFWGESISRALDLHGLTAMGILLIIAGFIHERQLTIWSFPALGILLYTLPATVLDLLFHPNANGPPPPGFDFLAAVFPLVMWAAAVIVAVRQRPSPHIPGSGWGGVCLVILLIIAAGTITSTFADQGPDRWRSLLSSFVLSLWWTGMILLPVVAGLPLARRNGLLAGLMVVTSEFWLVDEIFDPGYALGLWTSSQTMVKMVSVIPALFFLVVTPIWVLRSRSTRGRVWGLLMPAFLALLTAEIIGSTVRPYYSDIWLTRATGAVEFLIALALAVVMYDRIERQGPARPDIHPGNREILNDKSASIDHPWMGVLAVRFSRLARTRHRTKRTAP